MAKGDGRDHTSAGGVAHILILSAVSRFVSMLLSSDYAARKEIIIAAALRRAHDEAHDADAQAKGIGQCDASQNRDGMV